jgi:indolepyruvate ferredoxin oxidoreductase alpha subunit
MEVSFKTEIEKLRLGDGEIFRGEGILAVTKALLQSGVAYVGGYQGAPVSHLLDVLVQSQDLLDDLGVHLQTCTNEAAAAAMLGASINYPLRGAVTWKSIVGTNVASDALSNLSSAGVIGGALIVGGEDYGEGASVIQERTHAFALKSSFWLMDPRPNVTTISDMVEHGFALSEASNTPVMMELRIRACHVYGEFAAKDNKAPKHSTKHRFDAPAEFNYDRLSHPPATFKQEQDKLARRRPAAEKYIVEHGLNEEFTGDLEDIGIILQGGHYNAVVRGLTELGLADSLGQNRVPLLVLNVTHPLVPNQIEEFCAGKRSVLIVEEGTPAFIEQSIEAMLRKGELTTKISGKDVLPEAGEYNPETLLNGIAAFVTANNLEDGASPWRESLADHRATANSILGAPVPARPPTFCTGCPERPVFTALKLLQKDIGKVHISADIGCHALATFAPFHSGNSILGYGMSLAAASAVGSTQRQRPISIMGDGGFWHNGLSSGVAGAVLNQDESVLVIMDNGYSSATGIQAIPSSVESRLEAAPRVDIETTLRAMGVGWIKKVRTFGVEAMQATLRDAVTNKSGGPKVIVADGECQLARHRRLRDIVADRLKRGRRDVRIQYGVDEDVCTGDRACIRLSGCPSLSIKPNPDPLRDDPVTTVLSDCVGCGLCGDVAHAAQLCPSFYHAEIIRNPSLWDRMVAGLRAIIIGKLAGGAAPTQ